jgi:hypothetical protein
LNFLKAAAFFGFAAGLLAQTGAYGGPSVLSRGKAASNRDLGPASALRPYLYLNGIYDNGLTPVSVDQTGQVPRDDVYGGEAGVGLYGYRRWKQTLLGVDYRGNFRHYSRKTYYDGSDHALALDFTHQPSRRVTFGLRQSAGTFSRSFGWLPNPGIFDPTYSHIPADEIFDNRTNYLSTRGDLTWQKSLRLSFNAGGEGFMVRRRSNALFGVTGYTARGDISYRLGRHSTIGIDYNFLHFDFVRVFGASDLHMVAINYARRLSPTWEVALRLGGGRIETQSLRQVRIDPVVAAIIGQQVGIETFHQLHYVPHGGIRLAKTFRSANLQLAYDRTVSPGNGVLLTSRAEQARVSYSFTGLRYWNFGLNAGYSAMHSVTHLVGSYEGYHGGWGATRRLGKNFHAVARFDARRYDMGGLRQQFDRVMYRATLGIAFSPGDMPLSLW